MHKVIRKLVTGKTYCRNYVTVGRSFHAVLVPNSGIVRGIRIRCPIVDCDLRIYAEEEKHTCSAREHIRCCKYHLRVVDI